MADVSITATTDKEKLTYYDVWRRVEAAAFGVVEQEVLDREVKPTQLNPGVGGRSLEKVEFCVYILRDTEGEVEEMYAGCAVTLLREGDGEDAARFKEECAALEAGSTENFVEALKRWQNGGGHEDPKEFFRVWAAAPEVRLKEDDVAEETTAPAYSEYPEDPRRWDGVP